MGDFFKKLSKHTNFRLIVMFFGVAMLFSALVIKLFNLQIILGEFLQNQVTGTTLKEIVVPAPRGSIYDRYGRPLAINTSSFTVNIDASATVDNINEVILKLVELLEKNDEEILDEFPISKEAPYTFLFDGSETQEKRWKRDMDLEDDLSATEAFKSLREKFEIDEKLSDEDARKILSLRCELYEKRYSKFMPVTVAYNIKKETIGSIEEEKSSYPGVYVDVEALRNYPSGNLFSHILGYIRGITEAELSTYAQYGYTQNDIIGKDGIEKSFELELNGIDGKTYAEVDSLGRRINTIDTDAVNPIPGNNIFLTVDKNLQDKAYNIFEKYLTEAIISRLTGQSKDFTYNIKQLLMSMADSNNVKIEKILEENSDSGSAQAKIKNYILSVDKTAMENKELARQILTDGIDRGSVSQNQIILVLYEQGIITADEKYLARIKSGSISALQVVIDKMRAGEITPQMTAMDPCTGSVVVTDVHSGDILASVTYPSYDNNRFVNNFDNDYYRQLQQDPTTPLVNRAFQEPRAPGSTFKMITAVAGLEEGIISPNSTIYDHGTFKDAGKPYARCWIGSGKGSHGSINVSHALEVSCNYFFYDLSYRMGNAKNGNSIKGIQTLNKYMKAFGLDDPTGVEVYELYNSTRNYPSRISSPEYKKYIYTLRNPDISESEVTWRDGDTIRTAIGQSFNNYTSATMAKYVATLANGGTRYSMHFLNKIMSSDGTVVNEYTPKIETTIDIKPQNLKAVHDGMLLVTAGEKGTLRNVFKGFPIKVAAKSGTAQQSSYRSEHTLFVGFAPYDDPQIAITVLIPFGNDTTSPAPKIAKEVIGEYLGLNATSERDNYDILSE